MLFHVCRKEVTESILVLLARQFKQQEIIRKEI